MAATGEDGFARNFLCLIGDDGDAASREKGPGQQLREDSEEEVELNLGLSLGGLFVIDGKGDELPRSSSVMAVPTPPVEVPTTPAVVRRASGSASSASSERGGQRLQGSLLTPPVEVPAPAPPILPRASSLHVQEEELAARLPASRSPSSASLERDTQRYQGTVMRTSSVPAVIESTGNIECTKRKETQSLKRLEINKKMIERTNSATSSTPKEAARRVAEENKNHSSGNDAAKRRRGRPPKYEATLMTPQGTTVTEESSSSSVPSSSKAARRVTAASRPLPPSSLAPRTAAATLGSSRDQSILAGRGAAARANSTGGDDDVGRRLMQEMPGVHTKDLPNGNRVDGFLYRYREADDVRIVCLCHGSFLTPSEFVEHAGAGKVDNPLRHISVSRNQTL